LLVVGHSDLYLPKHENGPHKYNKPSLKNELSANNSKQW